jgi:cAMP-dependent protein kinase regulator
MGCGGSKHDLDYNSMAQAMIEKEKEKIRERELQQAKPSPAKSADDNEQFPDHNIEPDQGFTPMSIYNPNSVANVMTDKERALGLAKQSSAANLMRPAPSPTRPPIEKNKNGKKPRRMGGAHHLRNVFAKPFDQQEVSSFQAPRFDKTSAEMDFLRLAMRKNFVFTNLSERQTITMLEAFEKVKYRPQKKVMNQGEEGDYFFVVLEGELHFEVDGVASRKIQAGQSFGELALLYESPRSASAVSDSDCVLFRVDQKTFRYIMQTQREHAEQDKRVLLEGVPFFKDLDETDLGRLADAMIPRRFAVDEFLAKKGDPADTFCIVQEGKVRATDLDVGQTRYQDSDLGPGEHFGERALIKDEPREANFRGKTKGVVLAINKDQFHEILGDFSDLIHKSQDKKRLVSDRSFGTNSGRMLFLIRRYCC